MDDRDRDFLLEVFKETGAHIRTTERKSLIVTGAYIGLFSVLLSSLARTCLTNSPMTISWLSVAIQIFFLLIGTCIYVMQQWYRAWKEHYLEVCLRIRKEFIPDSNLGTNERILPYWLRKEGTESKVSIDNLLKYLTVIINFILVILISYQILQLQENKSLAIIIVVLSIASYIGIVGLTQNRIKKSKNLFA